MTNFEYLKEELVADLIMLIMDDFGMGLKEAFDALYNSETYEKLSDPKTGLYLQSAGYIYTYLRTEITTGKIG